MADYEDLFHGLKDDHATWLRTYLNADKPATFLRAGPSAVAIGKPSQFGYSLKQQLEPRISSFLADSGLHETSLRAKLCRLLEARETTYKTVPGVIDPWDAPEGVEILGTFIQERPGLGGSVHQEQVTLLALHTEAQGLQLKALDLAMKHQGMIAPVKQELSGPNGGAIVLNDIERAARIEFLRELERRESG